MYEVLVALIAQFRIVNTIFLGLRPPPDQTRGCPGFWESGAQDNVWKLQAPVTLQSGRARRGDRKTPTVAGERHDGDDVSTCEGYINNSQESARYSRRELSSPLRSGAKNARGRVKAISVARIWAEDETWMAMDGVAVVSVVKETQLSLVFREGAARRTRFHACLQEQNGTARVCGPQFHCHRLPSRTSWTRNESWAGES